MSKTPINFTTSAQGGLDLDDLFIRRGLFTHGGLWGWGENLDGQLGDATIANKSSPVQTVAGGTNWKQIACGVFHTAAIKTDGTLWLWGDNAQGPLGNNANADKSSPVQTVAGGTNWKQVSAGEYTSAAIKTDGTLWVWGANGYGELGTNNDTGTSSPVQTVAGGTNWKYLSIGGSNTGAIKTDGTLWSWGRNDYGQLGDNTIADKSSPVQTVSGGNDWKYISCYLHTAAIKTDGTLWLWGNNGSGQLGIDSFDTGVSSPVQTVAGGTNWKQISCGVSHTAAVKTDGTLWVWGYNLYGQLGDNTRTDRFSPVQTVSGGTNWRQTSCGLYHTAAIKTDGTLWLWGYNPHGELGDNTIANKSSPVQTVAGGTNWKQISGGLYHTLAIKENN